MREPALSEYVDLIARFVGREMAADEFERGYLRIFKDDPTMRNEEIYDVLNGLFACVDAFSPSSELRGTDGLDEDQLRAAASEALGVLRVLSRRLAHRD